jgi:hypothetical protein
VADLDGNGIPDIKTALSCGVGFELAFLLPPLIWAYGRRRRSGVPTSRGDD